MITCDTIKFILPLPHHPKERIYLQWPGIEIWSCTTRRGEGRLVVVISSKIYSDPTRLLDADVIDFLVKTISRFYPFDRDFLLNSSQICRVDVTAHVQLSHPLVEYLIVLSCLCHPCYRKPLYYPGESVAFDPLARRSLNILRVSAYLKDLELQLPKNAFYWKLVQNKQQALDYFSDRLRIECEIVGFSAIRRAFGLKGTVGSASLATLFTTSFNPLHDSLCRLIEYPNPLCYCYQADGNPIQRERFESRKERILRHDFDIAEIIKDLKRGKHSNLTEITNAYRDRLETLLFEKAGFSSVTARTRLSEILYQVNKGSSSPLSSSRPSIQDPLSNVAEASK